MTLHFKQEVTWNYKHIFCQPIQPLFTTSKGLLFEDDCLNILYKMNSSCVDMIFADPPFNLGKSYGSKVDDERSKTEYLSWMYSWISECVRILKDGGSIFIYNLPKWNIFAGYHLDQLDMNFRHWIAIDIKMSMPIQGRLYPSHYSLLYYSKGQRPKTFKKIRTPIQVCRHCGGEIKDYGGHRKSMNPNGVNLSDVWSDITPVRHWKYKSKKRKSNQLSTKLLSRVLDMATNPGDLVLDPFGGSGTTFSVCESKHRHWVGVEIESCEVIIERLTNREVYQHSSYDYVEE
ncbi:site-specific DNA-methyltransferase [Spirulina major CS-329]|nr:site-specific DNA-methyltransferase [Spirulina major]MDB9496074.1 site-specific DNA-methyltransferase [Spirulina subsalsa CS-330]MDB9503408.1 site-specific DNA-methyltransferase [Spirulina major CS-329]